MGSLLLPSPSASEVLHNKMTKKFPRLWSELPHLKGTIQDVEEAAAAKLRAHWEVHALRLFARARFTRDGYQSFINLDSHTWCPKIEGFVRVKFPGGTPLPLRVSYPAVIKQRDEFPEELGVKHDLDKIIFNVRKSLVARLEYLDSIGRLTECWQEKGTLLVQFLADAAKIYSAKQTKGTCMVLKPIYDVEELPSRDRVTYRGDPGPPSSVVPLRTGRRFSSSGACLSGASAMVEAVRPCVITCCRTISGKGAVAVSWSKDACRKDRRAVSMVPLLARPSSSCITLRWGSVWCSRIMWSPVDCESRSGCIGVARKVAFCGIHPSCLRGPGGGSVLLFLVLLFVLAIYIVGQSG